MQTLNEQDLILVNNDDQAIGTKKKLACHFFPGYLHRAFSVFIFNTKGQLLVQKRSQYKPLWPLYWSNSCCSHPRPDKNIHEEVPLRVLQELGIQCDVEFLFKFSYEANYKDIGCEKEYCHVYYGISDDIPKEIPEEVDSYMYVPINDVEHMFKQDYKYTPWFELEWKTITEKHANIFEQECFLNNEAHSVIND